MNNRGNICNKIHKIKNECKQTRDSPKPPKKQIIYIHTHTHTDIYIKSVNTDSKINKEGINTVKIKKRILPPVKKMTKIIQGTILLQCVCKSKV